MGNIRSILHWSTLLSIVAWGVLGVAFVDGYMDANRELFRDRPAKVLAGLYLWMLAGFGMIWLTAVAHEIGHAAAASLVGRRVHAFAVGPIGWTRDHAGRLRFGRVRRFKGNAGYVIAFGEAAVHTRGRDIVYYLGGCIANLIVATACYLVYAQMATPTGRGIAAAMAYVNFVFAALNLVPLRARSGMRSDGRWVVDRLLDRIPPEQQLVLDAARLQVVGVRPRDLPGEIVERLKAVDQSSSFDASNASVPPDEVVVARHLLHEVALDSADNAEATRHYNWLAGLFERLPDHLQNSLASTLAWYAAHRLRDATAARRFVGTRVESPTHAAYRTSAMAAIALAEGKIPEARRLADQSLREFERHKAFHAMDAMDRLAEIKASVSAAEIEKPSASIEIESGGLRLVASPPQSPLP